MHWKRTPQIQALAPIGLALQGAFMLGVQGDFRPVPWVVVIAVGLMGFTCWMQVLPRPPLTLGAVAILVGGFVLFIHTGGTRSFFMPWYLVLVAVYSPRTLLRRIETSSLRERRV